ncbi:MAG: hypothetical protein FK732_03910 [Asgard group archaeon]|nr:hypothetical protein [Asgard group archaeon]
MKRNKIKQFMRDNKKGQIFLVCAVIMTIYMLSFINIVFELNRTQYTEGIEIREFQATFDNFRTETNDFVVNMLANFSQPATIIDSNITAGIILQNWLDFSEVQMLGKGYIAVFDIDEIIPGVLPVELVSANGRMSFRGDIDVFMECNYMSIVTQLSFNFSYSLTYTNTATNAIIDFYYETVLGITYLGYSQVTVNAAPTIDLFNGTYIHSAPLAPADIVVGTSADQVIVTLNV